MADKPQSIDREAIGRFSMGMTDSVVASCPHCGTIISWHTSAGLCLLKEWDADLVPGTIARTMIGDKETCRKCHKRWALIPRDLEAEDLSFDVVEVARTT